MARAGVLYAPIRQVVAVSVDEFQHRCIGRSLLGATRSASPLYVLVGGACYVRIGMVGQNEAGQHQEIQRWLASNGIDPRTVRWYLDKATGDNLDRPGFEQL